MTAASSPPRPNFFIVGAMKAGTSSMHQYLAQHPQVFMSERKEPRYFAPDLDSGSALDGEWFTRDLDAYLANFADASDAQVIGESSHVYLHSSEAAHRIKEFASDAKILIMLRDPVQMVYARHQQSLWAGREDITDFAEALAAEADRRAGRRLPARPIYARGLQYREACVMTPQVRRFFDEFGRDRVHIVLLEDMAQDRLAIYRSVLEFLGVDPDFVPSDMGVAKQSRSPRSLGLRHTMIRLRGLRRSTKSALPTPVRRAVTWILRVRELNKRVAPRAPMAPELEQELTRYFAPDVARLSELLGRDLKERWPRFQRPADAGRPASVAAGSAGSVGEGSVGEGSV